jgi:uncharacterized protein (TIGR00730 family)
MNITVFGGSQPKAGDESYAEAYELGKLLASAGHTILTGGYIGTMEAVSRGASEGGGHVIGVTCDEIENWRKVKPNAWVQEERRFQTLEQRLSELIHSCQAAIALPGGPGTLTEIALTWNLMIIAAIPPKPLILVGESWKTTLKTFISQMDSYISEKQRSLLSFSADGVEAVRMLDHWRH